MLMHWSLRRHARPVAALLVTAALVGCSGPAAEATVPASPTGTDQPAPTAVASSASSASPTFAAGGLGPRSWVASVLSEEHQTFISIARDLATDTVLRFPVGEKAVAVGGGRVATLQWDEGPDSVTTLRLLDASTGIESQRAVINGLTASVAIRENDVLFSVQGPGRDGGVWSLPAGSSTPVSLIAGGKLPSGSDAIFGGRYGVWTSQSGRTVAADLLRTLDQVSLDVFAGQEAPRRIDLPERANIVGLTDEVALVMSMDFLGAVDLEGGAFLWRIEVSSVSDYFLTPDGRSVVAALVLPGVPDPRPRELMVIDLATGDARTIKEWAGDEQSPRLWRELSTDEVVVVGDEGDLGYALLVGDWSATGTAIRLSDGEVAGSVAVTIELTPVP